MNFCKDCKYWNERKGSELGVRYGRCDKVPTWWDAWEWRSDKDDSVYVGTSLAYAQDGSDYKAWLITLAEFGCVQWEGIRREQ